MGQSTKIIIGPIIHSESQSEVTIIPLAAVVITQGKLTALEELPKEFDTNKLKKKYGTDNVTLLSDGQFLIPGLIDTHIHAPQFPNAGIGYDKTLLDWLNSYTFPLESCYQDTKFARRIYSAVVNKTLSCGTTTAVYFGTVHRSSCESLAQIVHDAGQRALVGKVNMDCNSPSSLTEEITVSLKETESFIENVNGLKSHLVKPVITPRFGVTCSNPLLAKLGTLAEKYGLHIQTHLSENKEEIETVLKMRPDAKCYTEVYDVAKLLTRKSILAHCVHLSPEEVEILKTRGCSIAHCPNSNISLRSGLCDVRRLLNAGVNVALGTDVAGGYNPSILDAIRCALSTSISLSFDRCDYTPLTYHEVFYLATMGGAIALDMEDQLGNFAVGKYFDAVIVDSKSHNSPFEVLIEHSLSERFQKFIYTGDDRNIVKVYVNGELVVQK